MEPLPAAVPSLVATIAQAYGPLGAVVALLIVWVIYKDREWGKERAAWATERTRLEGLLAAEKDARIADAKGYTELALKLQQQVIEAVGKVTSILDELRKGRRP